MRAAGRGIKPPLSYTLPRLNPAVLAFVRAIAPLYLRSALGIRIEGIQGISRLADEYRRFQGGGSRLIIAFRHVNPDDAQVMFTLLNNRLPREARKSGARLGTRPHAHFLYGRGVPLWKGSWLTWLFSRLGGIPVARDELVRANIDLIRRYLLEARYPIALAPEAQVTYHNELLFPLEPGFAQFALWTLKALGRAGKDEEEVRILPVALHYRHGKDPEASFAQVLGALERDTGIALPRRLRGASMAERLTHIGGRVLDRCEEFYRHEYALFSELPRRPGEFSRRRVELLTDGILQLPERRLGVCSRNNSFLSRIFAVKRAGWSRLFRERGEGDRAPLEHDLEDAMANETRMLLRHVEVADILSYLTPEYALESADPNRAVEIALNLHDTIGRLRGGTIGDRMRIKPTYAQIRVGEAVSASPADNQALAGERRLRDELSRRTADEFERISRSPSAG